MATTDNQQGWNIHCRLGDFTSSELASRDQPAYVAQEGAVDTYQYQLADTVREVRDNRVSLPRINLFVDGVRLRNPNGSHLFSGDNIYEKASAYVTDGLSQPLSFFLKEQLRRGGLFDEPTEGLRRLIKQKFGPYVDLMVDQGNNEFYIHRVGSGGKLIIRKVDRFNQFIDAEDTDACIEGENAVELVTDYEVTLSDSDNIIDVKVVDQQLSCHHPELVDKLAFLKEQAIAVDPEPAALWELDVAGDDLNEFSRLSDFDDMNHDGDGRDLHRLGDVVVDGRLIPQSTEEAQTADNIRNALAELVHDDPAFTTFFDTDLNQNSLTFRGIDDYTEIFSQQGLMPSNEFERVAFSRNADGTIECQIDIQMNRVLRFGDANPNFLIREEGGPPVARFSTNYVFSKNDQGQIDVSVKSHKIAGYDSQLLTKLPDIVPAKLRDKVKHRKRFGGLGFGRKYFKKNRGRIGAMAFIGIVLGTAIATGGLGLIGIAIGTAVAAVCTALVPACDAVDKPLMTAEAPALPIGEKLPEDRQVAAHMKIQEESAQQDASEADIGADHHDDVVVEPDPAVDQTLAAETVADDTNNSETKPVEDVHQSFGEG